MPYKDPEEQRKAQREWARKNRAAKNTSKLDAQVENLAKRGVALPRHPIRKQQAAAEMHRMASTPGDLKATLQRTVGGPNAEDLRQMRENTKLAKQMRVSRMNKVGSSDTWAALPRFYDPMEYWDITGLPWNMADENHRRKLHKWLRLYYATHYLVPILIDIFHTLSSRRDGNVFKGPEASRLLRVIVFRQA